jgi:hypothetical protein
MASLMFLQTAGIVVPRPHGKMIVGHFRPRFSRDNSSLSVSSAESLKIMNNLIIVDNELLNIDYTGRGCLIHLNRRLMTNVFGNG